MALKRSELLVEAVNNNLESIVRNTEELLRSLQSTRLRDLEAGESTGSSPDNPLEASADKVLGRYFFCRNDIEILDRIIASLETLAPSRKKDALGELILCKGEKVKLIELGKIFFDEVKERVGNCFRSSFPQLTVEDITDIRPPMATVKVKIAVNAEDQKIKDSIATFDKSQSNLAEGVQTMMDKLPPPLGDPSTILPPQEVRRSFDYVAPKKGTTPTTKAQTTFEHELLLRVNFTQLLRGVDSQQLETKIAVQGVST